MRKFIGTIVVLGVFGLGIFVYTRIQRLEQGTPAYGVSFSKSYAEALGLDWREAYRAILDDLRAPAIRLPLYLNEVAREPEGFDFETYDWLVSEAAKRRATVILALGRKLPRGPECRIPEWVKKLSEKEQEERVRDYLIATVNRYKSFTAVIAWQVEDQPLSSIAGCPRVSRRFIEQEIALVRGLDAKPIIVTDSGVFSWWVSEARRADWFGTSIYRYAWTRWTGYFTYPIPPIFFKAKRVLTELIARPEKMIVTELQAEPVMPGEPPTRFPVADQLVHMNVERFRAILEYGRESGFDTFYLSGVEWWLWLKTKAEKPELWDEAAKLFPRS